MPTRTDQQDRAGGVAGPVAEAVPPGPAEADRVRTTVLDFLAGHRRARLRPVTDRLVETIQRDNRGYRDTGVVAREDLWRSCHDNVDRVLQLLTARVDRDEGASIGSHPDDHHAYDAARATGRRRAEQGLPLDDVLRSFRIGGRLIWDDLVAQAEGGPGAGGLGGLGPAQVRDLGTHLWAVVDETSAQVAAAYHAEQRSSVRADEQQRAELWEGLVSGRARDPRFALEVARTLDLPQEADLAVVVGPGLDAARAERALAPHASSWVRRTSDVVGVVALRDTVEEVVEALSEMVGTGAVGVSGTVAGLARVDRGFAQATIALRTLNGRAGPPAAGVVTFDSRLPEALLLGTPDVARRIVVRWLGPVLDLPAAESEVLLGTLSAWVAAGGSATGAAAAVPCHRNTVLNRVRRVAELVDLPLADGLVPLELDLALRAWRLG